MSTLDRVMHGLGFSPARARRYLALLRADDFDPEGIVMCQPLDLVECGMSVADAEFFVAAVRGHFPLYAMLESMGPLVKDFHHHAYDLRRVRSATVEELVGIGIQPEVAGRIVLAARALPAPSAMHSRRGAIRDYIVY